MHSETYKVELVEFSNYVVVGGTFVPLDTLLTN